MKDLEIILLSFLIIVSLINIACFINLIVSCTKKSKKKLNDWSNSGKNSHTDINLDEDNSEVALEARTLEGFEAIDMTSPLPTSMLISHSTDHDASVQSIDMTSDSPTSMFLSHRTDNDGLVQSIDMTSVSPSLMRVSHSTDHDASLQSIDMTSASPSSVLMSHSTDHESSVESLNSNHETRSLYIAKPPTLPSTVPQALMTMSSEQTCVPSPALTPPLLNLSSATPCQSAPSKSKTNSSVPSVSFTSAPSKCSLSSVHLSSSNNPPTLPRHPPTFPCHSHAPPCHPPAAPSHSPTSPSYLSLPPNSPPTSPSNSPISTSHHPTSPSHPPLPSSHSSTSPSHLPLPPSQLPSFSNHPSTLNSHPPIPPYRPPLPPSHPLKISGLNSVSSAFSPAQAHLLLSTSPGTLDTQPKIIDVQASKGNQQSTLSTAPETYFRGNVSDSSAVLSNEMKKSVVKQKNILQSVQPNVDKIKGTVTVAKQGDEQAALAMSLQNNAASKVQTPSPPKERRTTPVDQACGHRQAINIALSLENPSNISDSNYNQSVGLGILETQPNKLNYIPSLESANTIHIVLGNNPAAQGRRVTTLKIESGVTSHSTDISNSRTFQTPETEGNVSSIPQLYSSIGPSSSSIEKPDLTKSVSDPSSTPPSIPQPLISIKNESYIQQKYDSLQSQRATTNMPNYLNDSIQLGYTAPKTSSIVPVSLGTTLGTPEFSQPVENHSYYYPLLRDTKTQHTNEAEIEESHSYYYPNLTDILPLSNSDKLDHENC